LQHHAFWRVDFALLIFIPWFKPADQNHAGPAALLAVLLASGESWINPGPVAGIAHIADGGTVLAAVIKVHADHFKPVVLCAYAAVATTAFSLNLRFGLQCCFASLTIA
jgi:hypothetical protein